MVKVKRKIIRLYIVLLAIIYTAVTLANAQSGLKFAELAKRLEPYYDKEFIDDIKRQLPQGTDYTIWGWDVGDFSGDGFNDVSVSIKLASERRRVNQVYMFVDIEGFLTRVGQYPVEFVELPLEVGVVIKKNVSYITKKKKQYDWLIRGFTFDNGSLILLDEYTTTRLDKYTLETYRNYQSLQFTEKYINTTTNKSDYYTNFLVIPSYPRGKQIYRGYPSEAYSANVDYVHKGAYNWKGEEDCSFSVSSVYDSQYLYFTVKVEDDNVVTQSCDTCPADYLDIWFNVNKPDSTHEQSRQNFKSIKDLSSVSDSGIYCLSVYPGDFLEKKSFVKIKSTDELEIYQMYSASEIKSVSSTTDNGYILKFKIPFMVLGFQQTPIEANKPTELRCTIVIHDIDNEYRPEEETEIASSSFTSTNPSTYGSLILIPPEKWYGEATNIFRDDILKYLMEYGF